MAAGTNPIFVKALATSAVTFVNADSTTAKTLVTAGADGTRIETISATSDDTVARDIEVSVHDGSTNYVVGTVTVAIGAGYTTVAAASLLTQAKMPWLSPDGSITIENGWTIKVRPTVAVTAAKTVAIAASGGDY
jgi:hypothetical protein